MKIELDTTEKVELGGLHNPEAIALLGSRPMLRRFRYGNEKTGGRYYYDRFHFYLSVTTFIRKSETVETAINDGYDFLDHWEAKLEASEWAVSMGVKAENILKNTAAYGTFFHEFVSEYIQGKVTYRHDGQAFEVAKNMLRASFARNGVTISDAYEQNILSWFRNDMHAFLKWIEECNVVFWATNIPIKSEKYRVAGCADVICELDTNPQNKKDKGRKLVVLDFKTNAKGQIYSSYRRQVCTYQKLLLDAYPNLPLEGAFIWQPKLRSTSGGNYSLTDCTNTYTDQQINHELSGIMINGWHVPKANIVVYKELNRTELTASEWLHYQYHT